MGESELNKEQIHEEQEDSMPKRETKHVEDACSMLGRNKHVKTRAMCIKQRGITYGKCMWMVCPYILKS